LTQNKAEFCKILIITLVLEKSANFFAENCQKSQKIVIMTSTPDLFKGGESASGLPDVSWYNIPKRKKYTKNHIHTIPNGHKTDQASIK
jgi:hypothetical protein